VDVCCMLYELCIPMAPFLTLEERTLAKTNASVTMTNSIALS
jgi:hypothetical protein